MTDTGGLGLALAFTGGVLSFLSPCVLPLFPSYLTFITGLSLEEVQGARRAALVHSLLFILGFTAVFVTLGATATLLGRVLAAYRAPISRIGGALIVLFGLNLLGVFEWGVLSRERRVHLAAKPVGYLGSALVGVAFGAGWTPCIGPILGSILIYTSTAADLRTGLPLLFAYSLGLAAPFLLASLAVSTFVSSVQRYRSWLAWAGRLGGAFLIIVGLLLATGYFTLLASWLQPFTPEAIRSRL